MSISLLEEEYLLISLLANLYHSFKVTLKATQKGADLSKEMEKLDQQFVENYASTYWFYHQSIRIDEVLNLRKRLPHFPIVLLKYFRLNEFLNNLRVRGNLKDILTFLNSTQRV